MGLSRLSYVSVAAPGVGDAEVARIVATAQHYNALNGVTGALLSYAGHFLQVIEGPASAVDVTYRHIVADARHHHVVLLEHEPVTARLFGTWSMRHVSTRVGHDRAVSGFLDDLGERPDRDQAHTALTLLQRLADTTT